MAVEECSSTAFAPSFSQKRVFAGYTWMYGYAF